MRRASFAELIMEDRDVAILRALSDAIKDIADDFDLHEEQVRALLIGSLSDEEIRYAMGEVQ